MQEMQITIPAILLAMLACSTSSPPEGDGNAPRTMTASLPDSLRLSLTAPSEAAQGDVVPIAITLSNRGTRPVTLYLRGRDIVFDIHVIDARGDTVWQRLYDQVIPAIVQVKEVRAGESLELRDTWNLRSNKGAAVAAGDFTIFGSILRDEPEPMKTPSVSLSIVPSRSDRNQ